MEPIAYGQLGLKPWEFAEMTPREFRATLDAQGDVEMLRREQRAWAVGHLLAVLTKKTITLDRLLGPTYTAWRLRRAQAASEHQAEGNGAWP